MVVFLAEMPYDYNKLRSTQLLSSRCLSVLKWLGMGDRCVCSYRCLLGLYWVSTSTELLLPSLLAEHTKSKQSLSWTGFA